MNLSRIKLRNYKSIQNLDLDLKSINILIGANGAGKSNFLSAFTLLKNIIDKNLQNYIKTQGGADRILYNGSMNSDSLSIEVNFGRHSYSSTLKSNKVDSFFFEKETLSYSPNKSSIEDQDLGFGQNETNIYEVQNEYNLKNYRKLSGHLADLLEDISIFHLDNTSSDSLLRKTSNIEDHSILHSNGSNLAAFLYNLSLNSLEYFNLIESTVKLFLPNFNGFKLKPSGRYVNLEWREKQSQKYYDGFDFSDGTLRMIFFTTLLLQPHVPKILIIDEPELGLHPYSMSLLASLLLKSSLKSTLILATQSGDFIDFFKPQDVIIVDRSNNTAENGANHAQSTFKRVDSKSLSQWLKNYKLSEIWDKNLIGARPR